MTQATFIRFGSPEIERVSKDIGADIVEGNPEQGSWLYSNDTQTGTRFGIWECSAGKFNASYKSITEFCHILEGEAHITNLADGSIQTVKAGDSFVMEAGFEAQWHVPVHIKKCFAISDLIK
ncbi:cupin domain-containing protein [Granulosicoccus antarcticus]|uniref:(S)-ureidoglycine aminohydrolase cupin domain-containing protein n=1 Tax=Granulosicoccus antarcticus IMCC3135 TaxID=1192854 RepID=A0A2Z2P0S3_9GAMM|nr:cupin domain-containing protein [Granulosicoccus antarcticus]ASJ73847.1 hypothetical protein IMCC3135_18840 [Granulosicoccus antarcticus IMCC3135]